MSVETVLGAVSAAELGPTLTHEHICMDFSHFYVAPPPHAAAALAVPPRLATAGSLRQYPYSSRYNLRLDDDDARAAVLHDLAQLRAAGGGCVVENTTRGLGRDTAFLVRAARESGLHVVAGTGHYVAELQAEADRAASVETLYAHMRAELLDGCVDLPAVRAGFMGEIASVWPLHDMEKRAIRAAGEVQEETGHGVSFHPHRVAEAPAHIMRLYLEAGGRPEKAVMSHLDRTLSTREQLLQFAELGGYCQLDLFGVEVSLYQLAPQVAMPSDAQRLERVLELVDAGFAERVLLSHDIHTKHRLTHFGGHGYAHLLLNVLPRLELRGIHPDLVRQITVRNPAAWLAR